MKLIPTEFLVPGMTLEEDVITQNNQMIASRATILTDKLISRLEFYNIAAVKISTEAYNETEEPSAPASVENGYSEKIKKSEEFQSFSTKLDSTTEAFTDKFAYMLSDEGEINIDDLYAETMDIIPKNATTLNVFDLIHNTRQHNDPIYAHSINVALISNILGKWLGFAPEDLKVLTVAGLLHDIGKSKIPENILNKPGKLSASEFEIIKNHPIYGNNLLKNRGLDKRITNAALQHHERCDGSGYPNGLKGYQMDDFSKIVAIADVYDAMTASRDFRDSTCPFKVVEIFEQEGLGKYDTHYIMTFLERIVLTYMHNNVRLSDGRIGQVVMINKLALARPIVQIGETFVDLSTEKNLSIESIV
jgi:putative nucleotidyltransferase with HDIG domain